MSTYYKGEPLLEFTLFINFMDIIYPFTHSIEKPELLSKGLGSISYLLLARQLYLKTGKALGSDFRISTPAKNIWERFIVLGLAKKTGPIYQFKESVLNENSRWQEIDAILSRTPFEKGFFDSINKSTFDF